MNRRGVTLIELMVGLAILAVILAITMNALLGIQEVVEISNLKRLTHANVQRAAQFIERDLRTAGFGIEPAMAIDFSIYAGNGAYCDGSPGGDVGTNTCPARRDRIDGPDELVFYGRNPGYWGGDLGADPEGRAWRLITADEDSVTVNAHGGEVIARGQILQLVCSGGSTSVYVRVRSNTAASGAGPVSVPVEGAVTGDPFTQNPEPFVARCGGMARAFQVDRYRYFIDPAVVLADGSTAPFLMLDMGVDRNADNVIDAEDLIPVAQNIVDLQVGYLRPDPGLTEVGTTRGVPIAWCNEPGRPLLGPVPCAGGLRVVQFSAGPGAADYPSYTYLVPAGGAGLRQGPDAGNITAIRIGLVARANRRSMGGATHPLLLNRSSVPPGETNQNAIYVTSEVTVVTPNLQSRGMTFL